ncbi:hypothetical protein BSLG_005755 [Batrachochytrium salamandrivorans]|nr:hypothetical protein BSLG_005755 [Batrachochytrium salamandrivorans]
MTHNLRRLEAQRNQLNAKVRLLREELQLLQEPGSYVGEVVKVMGKTKVLVKVNPEGKYVVDIHPSIDLSQLTPNVRVALRHDSYQLYKVLPNKIRPTCIAYDARAVAHHTDCRFIRVSGSELVQKYIGEGLRMFSAYARASNQLDGFEATQSIKVIMATNRRIDRKIEFLHSTKQLVLIFKIHSRKMNLTRGIDLHKIAEQMIGASGAEVKGVCTEAGMYALRERRVHVIKRILKWL